MKNGRTIVCYLTDKGRAVSNGLRRVYGTETVKPRPVYTTEAEVLDDCMHSRITWRQYERETARLRG